MGDERISTAVDVQLGRRVRARRLELGMSQERLAELLGITFQQVQKYEKGVNRIAASRLFDIANCLDAPIPRFFEGLTSARDGKVATDSVKSILYETISAPEGLQLVSLFSSIKNAKVRRQVVDVVKALVDEDDQPPRSGKRRNA